MFVQSEKFVESHGGRIGDIAIYGQESNYTTWRLAEMNLAVRGIDADIRWNNEGSFHKDELKDLRFDYVLANPPFNISDWGGERRPGANVARLLRRIPWHEPDSVLPDATIEHGALGFAARRPCIGKRCWDCPCSSIRGAWTFRRDLQCRVRRIAVDHVAALSDQNELTRTFLPDLHSRRNGSSAVCECRSFSHSR